MASSIDLAAPFGLTQQQSHDDAEPAAKPKRKRAPPAKKTAPITVIGDRFVDSYTGQLSTHGIFVPGVSDKVFVTLPNAVRWIMEFHNGDVDLIATTCEAYGQSVDNVRPSFRREELLEFGGKLLLSEWEQNHAIWRQHALEKGSTVAEWRKGGAKKTKTGVTFDAGSYVIPYKGKSMKPVNALDTDKAEKGKLSTLAAFKKVHAFAKKHEGASAQYFVCDGADIIVCKPFAPTEPDAGIINNTATQLVGETVIGPAVAVFHRKKAVKL